MPATSAGEIGLVLLGVHFWGPVGCVRGDIVVVGDSGTGLGPPQAGISDVRVLLWV